MRPFGMQQPAPFTTKLLIQLTLIELTDKHHGRKTIIAKHTTGEIFKLLLQLAAVYNKSSTHYDVYQHVLVQKRRIINEWLQLMMILK